MSDNSLENAILSMARDAELLERVRQDPAAGAAELGITEEWVQIIVSGDRDRLRSAGVNDGVTILVSRWFQDDIGDSLSQGKLHVDTTTPLPPKNLPTGLVFAGGASHVPDLLARPEIDPEDGVKQLLAGYERMAEDLKAADPDVILVTADCHFQSFETHHYVIGDAQTHIGSMEFFKRPDLDLNLTGNPEVAKLIADAVRKAGLEVEVAPRVDLDHGLVVPLRLMLPRPDVAVVPIITQPHRSFSPYGARAFGQAMRSAVEQSGLKVAMLATGGLSHWLDPGKFGGVDIEFDNYLLDMLKAGRGNDIANLEPYPLLDHGQYEFPNWLIMLGLVGEGVRGEVYSYQPMEASGGGWTVVRMMLEDEPS